MSISTGELHNLQEISADNARTFFNEGKEFASQGKYGRAFFFIVMCLEESAKSRICMMHAQYVRQSTREGGRRVRGAEIVPEEKLNVMFGSGRAHSEKRLTVLTQTIFALLNTFDKQIKQEVNDSIRARNPDLSPKITQILTDFKQINELRNKGLYVEKDQSGPDSVTEQNYQMIRSYAEIALGQLNTFAGRSDEPYLETEAKIKEMFDSVNVR